MWKGKFRDGDHLDDVGSEDIFGHVEVRIGKVLDHVLL